MRTNTLVLSAMSVGIGIIAISAIAGPPKDPKAKFKAFEPVEDVHHMMEAQDMLYNNIKDQIIDKSWDEAETSAWVLAELANVNHFQSSEKRYQDFADAMSKDCVALAKAAKGRDARAARAAMRKVQQDCKACHDVYQKEE